jgi:hypothetical protein
MASFLHQHHAFRLAVLFRGPPFAKGRRTVTSWLRAAGVGADLAVHYHLLPALGHSAHLLAGLLLQGALRRLDGQAAAVRQRRHAEAALRPEGPGRRRSPQLDAGAVCGVLVRLVY